MITAPIMNKQTTQATTIKAIELVGLIKSSNYQLETTAPVEYIIN
jgi:hypothetical protein